MEATQTPTHGGTGKQNLADTAGGIFSLLKKAGHSDTGYHMDGPRGRRAD